MNSGLSVLNLYPVIHEGSNGYTSETRNFGAFRVY